METKQKVNQPSSPRDFFARIYGHLETPSSSVDRQAEVCGRSELKKQDVTSVVTPIPMLAPLQHLPSSLYFRHPNDTHCTAAAAARITAFCE